VGRPEQGPISGVACKSMLRRRPRSAGPAPKRRSGPWVGAPGSCPGNPWTIVATKVTGAGGTAGATGAMAIRALTFARLGPRWREGRAAPRRNHKADTIGAASEAGGLNIVVRTMPLGAPCARRCRRNSRPQRMPPGQATLVPPCQCHKGHMERF
jgi:hypothetical protein